MENRESWVLTSSANATTRIADGPESGKVIACCRWLNCHQTVESLSELENHLLDFHWRYQCSAGNLSCLVVGCDFNACSDVILRRHILFHSYHAALEVKGNEYLSKSEQTRLIVHCNSESQHRPNEVSYCGQPLVCLWDGCKCAFDGVAEFFRHVNGHIDRLNEEDKEECPFGDCGDENNGERSNNEMFYFCKWQGCSEKYKRKYCLRIHLQHHSGEKAIACPFCGGFFANATKLSDHAVRKLGTDVSRLKCFLCQKTFPTQRLLREHSRRHVKHYKCQFCNMTVETPSDLRAHIMNRHTTEKKFFCAICSKRFHRAGDVKKHMTTHRDTAEFPCDLCEMRFKWKSSLDSHKKAKHRKTDQLPYMCHICPKQFARGGILSKHIISVHDIQVPSGHSRFIYKKCSDGFYRLQTERYESPELAAQLQSQTTAPTTAGQLLTTYGDVPQVDYNDRVVVSSSAGQSLLYPVEQENNVLHVNGSAELTEVGSASIVNMMVNGVEQPVIVLPQHFQLASL